MDSSNTTFLVTVGAIIAACAAGWSYVKGFFAWVRGLVFISVLIRNSDDSLQNAIRLYCMKNYKETRLGSRSFGSFFRLVYTIRRTQLIGMETLSSQGMIYWNGWNPLFMKLVLTSEGYPRAMNLIFIRGMWNIDDFIEKSIEYYNMTIGVKVKGFQRHRIIYIFGKNKQQLEIMNSTQGEPDVYNHNNDQEQYLNQKLLKWTLEDLLPPEHSTCLSDLYLSEPTKKMIKISEKWIQNEDWFYKHRVPWRLGVLAYGVPGTGKTAMFRALAQKLDLPVYVYDLASLSNEELFLNWRRMLANAPCMALIEDIDSVFEGRKNLTEVKGALTFNALLNCIDGVERCDGLFLAITTNKPDSIDAAIGCINKDNEVASRPGRVDYIIEMPNLTEEGRIEIAKRILMDCPEDIEKIVKDGDGDTGAQFQARCSEFAMESFKNGD